MINIRDKNFIIVSRSQNLRGILTYARNNPIERADLFKAKQGISGSLGITFSNGASCIADFASYPVMKNWVSKRRCFKNAQIKEAC